MDFVKAELGKKLSIKEVSEFLGIDARTVRKYYHELGGIKLGDRRFIFFEKEIINAIQRQTKQESPMGRPNQKGRDEIPKIVLHSQRGSGVGKGEPGGRSADPHGLFTTVG